MTVSINSLCVAARVFCGKFFLYCQEALLKSYPTIPHTGDFATIELNQCSRSCAENQKNYLFYFIYFFINLFYNIDHVVLSSWAFQIYIICTERQPLEPFRAHLKASAGRFSVPNFSKWGPRMEFFFSPLFFCNFSPSIHIKKLFFFPHLKFSFFLPYAITC